MASEITNVENVVDYVKDLKRFLTEGQIKRFTLMLKRREKKIADLKIKMEALKDELKVVSDDMAKESTDLESVQQQISQLEQDKNSKTGQLQESVNHADELTARIAILTKKYDIDGCVQPHVAVPSTQSSQTGS